MTQTDTLLLIDVHSLMNRAYYGLAGRNRLTAPDGLPTGALFAFLNMLLKYQGTFHPTHAVAALDSPGPVFRHKDYADYKAGRRPMPDDLARQIPVARELLSVLGYQPVSLSGYEADDLIGTFSRQAEEKGMRVYILSGDRDTLQLVSDRTSVVLLTTSQGKSSSEEITPDQMEALYGVRPDQWVDVKALMGDPSDHIPGVRGIGQKTALRLIQNYETLEGVYGHLADEKETLREKLEGERENARLSRRLSQICRDVPCPETNERLNRRIESLRQDGPLAALLTRLDFRSFLEKLNLDSVYDGDVSDGLRMEERVSALVGCDSCASFFGRLSEKDAFAFFLPKGGDDGVAVSENAFCTVRDAGAFLKRAFADTSGQAVTWDFKSQLRACGAGAPEKSVFDVMIASYLLNQLGRGDDIDFALRAALGSVYRPSGGETLPLLRDRSRERLETAYMLLQAMKHQKDALVQQDLVPLAQVEMELCGILADMEDKGVLIDREALEKKSEAMGAEIAGLEASIFREAGHPFNVNSSQQLAEVLFVELGLPHGKKSATGKFSTAQDQLDKIFQLHPIVPLVLEHRELSKLRSTFLEGLKKEIGPDGRVHTSYNQTVTATGRLSSSNPNLQNIPVRTARGRAIRELFIAPPGFVLIGADYSQIELRLLAHLSGDENLSAAFREGRDVHRVTAAGIFGKREDEVTQEERAAAKTVNFSITYGISDFGLSRDLGISIQRARTIIERYHAKYPRVESWLREQGERAKRDGFVETMLHRRRYMPELQSQNRNIYNFGLRAAMNAPVQGTAADLMKMAMVDAHRAFREAGVGASTILQVHDELIVETPAENADRVEQLLLNAMEHAMTLRVPLIAEAHRGVNWGAL